jgi:GDP-L-fucose synthase
MRPETSVSMPDARMTPPFDLAGRSVWVAGHRGMVGSAICRRLQSERCPLLVTARSEVDLTRQDQVETWMERHRPQVVVVAAARVGGILANATYPAEFLYENLAITANILWAAHRCGVEKLLYLGSSCIYPKFAPQPIREEDLMTGPLEPTNEAYAVAKIAGVKLAEAINREYGRAFVSAMPTNLYGPGDNFDPDGSHVVPALMRRIHEAKAAGLSRVTIWGSGRPTRDLLHVDDLAEACVVLLRHHAGPGIVNVGSGTEISIADLARLIAAIVGYEGGFEFDSGKPDGTPRKVLDTGRLTAMGWRSRIGLADGLRSTYLWWLERLGSAAPDIRGMRRLAG